MENDKKDKLIVVDDDLDLMLDDEEMEEGGQQESNNAPVKRKKRKFTLTPKHKQILDDYVHIYFYNANAMVKDKDYPFMRDGHLMTRLIRRKEAQDYLADIRQQNRTLVESKVQKASMLVMDRFVTQVGKMKEELVASVAKTIISKVLDTGKMPEHMTVSPVNSTQTQININNLPPEQVLDYMKTEFKRTGLDDNKSHDKKVKDVNKIFYPQKDKEDKDNAED